MGTRVDVAPEGKKWLPWAKRKLAQLRDLRRDLRLPKLTKAFQPEAGARIWLSAGEFGDWIRITAGRIPWLVLATSGLVLRRGRASPPAFGSPTFPYSDLVPIDETFFAVPSVQPALSKSLLVGARVDDRNAAPVVNITRDGVTEQSFSAPGSWSPSSGSVTAIRDDLVAAYFLPEPVGAHPNNKVDNRVDANYVIYRWDAEAEEWTEQVISMDFPEVRAAFDAADPALSREVTTNADPYASLNTGESFMVSHIPVATAGVFPTHNEIRFVVAHQGNVQRGVAATPHIGGRYVPVTNAFSVVESATPDFVGYESSDGGVTPDTDDRYELWSIGVRTHQFVHIIDLDEGTATEKFHDSALLTVKVWVSVPTTGTPGEYGVPVIRRSWAHSGEAIARYPSFGSTTGSIGGTLFGAGQVGAIADAAGVALSTTLRTSPVLPGAPTAVGGAIPATLWSGPGVSITPEYYNVTTADGTYELRKDASLAWTKTYPAATSTTTLAFVPTNALLVENYRLSGSYAHLTTGAKAYVRETGIASGVFADTAPDTLSPSSDRAMYDSVGGTFYAEVGVNGATPFMRVYDQADTLITEVAGKSGSMDLESDTTFWASAATAPFTVTEYTLTQDPDTLAWSAAEGTTYTPPTDVEFEGAGLPGVAAVQILPPSLIRPGVPT